MIDHAKNLELVRVFNTISFGDAVPLHSTEGIEVFRKQIYHVNTELDELDEHIKAGDWHNTRDDICDVLYFAYGAIVRTGIEDAFLEYISNAADESLFDLDALTVHEFVDWSRTMTAAVLQFDTLHMIDLRMFFELIRIFWIRSYKDYWCPYIVDTY